MINANPFLAIAAPGIAGLQPYLPGKPIAELERELGIRDSIKLASNENPLGPGRLAREAAVGALGELGRYPDGGGFALRAALAQRHGVEADAITLGNGSNDVLDLDRPRLSPTRGGVGLLRARLCGLSHCHPGGSGPPLESPPPETTATTSMLSGT